MFPINLYSHGSYFGDSDYLSYMAGVKQYDMREMTAITERPNTQMFVMKAKIVEIIKTRFPEIFDGMTKYAIKKYKYHQGLIHQRVSEHKKKYEWDHDASENSSQMSSRREVSSCMSSYRSNSSKHFNLHKIS